MRLLYVLDNYWPHIGGSERLFRELCESMVEQGHAVTVISRSLPGSPARERKNGVDIVRVASGGSVYAFALAAIVPVMAAARDADLLHAVTFASMLPAALAGRLRGKPVVLTVLETWVGRWRTYTEFGRPRAAVHDAVERCALALPFARYLTISRATERNLQRVLGSKGRRIRTIHPGFDGAPWRRPSDPVAARARLGLTPADFLIVAYGRPGTSKGFGYLADAAHHIRRRLPAATILLILSDAEEYRKERSALAVRAGANVTIHDSMPFEQLVATVRAADCVVVPSLTEGFGYAVLEAGAAGVPVVASDVASIPEVIGGRYRLTPPRDAGAIVEAVVAVARGEWTTTAAKDFPWSETARCHAELYRELVAERAAS